jgi:hypothetical protein
MIKKIKNRRANMDVKMDAVVKEYTVRALGSLFYGPERVMELETKTARNQKITR